MSTNEQKERIKARLFSRWLDDLKNDRQPEIPADISLLDDSDVEEVLGSARGIKAVIFPSSLENNEINQIRDAIMTKIADEQEQQVHEQISAIQQAKDFGQLISNLINKRGLDKHELVSELGIHETLLNDIETGKTPPVRLPISAMFVLLNQLGIATRGILELIRHSTLEWLARTYPSSETQIARIDFKIKDRERRHFLEDSKGEAKELEVELQRLVKYLKELEQRVT